MKNPIRTFREQETQITELKAVAQETEFLKERLSELESDMEGWSDITTGMDTEFSRGALTTICKSALLYFLKNPLIKRAVNIQTFYVFGSGVNIEAEEKDVNNVVQEFLTQNKEEIDTQQGIEEKENELQIYGNLFFTFFPGKDGVKLRMIPFDEIQAKITNPNDRKETWFYARQYSIGTGQDIKKLYRDYRFPTMQENEQQVIKDAGYGGVEIVDDVYIFHAAVNKLGNMQFGISEVYSALDWAKAYKEFLENWTTIVKSYARFAWTLTGKKKAGVRTSAGRVKTSGSEDKIGDIAAMTEGYKLDPVKTAGATTSMDDARRLLLMVCAATGIYEHYFGDPSTGNLATSTTMERPMELKFQARQSFWYDIFNDILQYVIDNAIEYGRLRLPPAKEGEEDVSRLIKITFPDLTQHGVKERIDAIVSATTLNGQTPSGSIPDMRVTTRLLLQALEVDEIDKVMAQLFPEGSDTLPNGEEMPKTATEAVKAIKEIRKQVEGMLNDNTGNT
jgi:hypothetical protein